MTGASSPTPATPSTCAHTTKRACARTRTHAHRRHGQRAMQLGAQAVFVGSGNFKSDEPARRARAIAEATTHFADPQILAKVSRGLGAPMTGIGMDEINQRYAERGW